MGSSFLGGGGAPLFYTAPLPFPESLSWPGNPQLEAEEMQELGFLGNAYE